MCKIENCILVKYLSHIKVGVVSLSAKWEAAGIVFFHSFE